MIAAANDVAAKVRMNIPISNVFCFRLVSAEALGEEADM
jgi:hypothetical protein